MWPASSNNFTPSLISKVKLGLVKDPFGYSKHSEQPGGKVMWQTTLNGEKAPEDFTSEKVITVIDSRQARLQKIVAGLMGQFKSDKGAYVHLHDIVIGGWFEQIDVFVLVCYESAAIFFADSIIVFYDANVCMQAVRFL